MSFDTYSHIIFGSNNKETKEDTFFINLFRVLVEESHSSFSYSQVKKQLTKEISKITHEKICFQDLIDFL